MALMTTTPSKETSFSRRRQRPFANAERNVFLSNQKLLPTVAPYEDDRSSATFVMYEDDQRDPANLLIGFFMPRTYSIPHVDVQTAAAPPPWSEQGAGSSSDSWIKLNRTFPWRIESQNDVPQTASPDSPEFTDEGSSLEGDNPNWALERLEAISSTSAGRIRKLAALERDWDGYGGNPPSDAAVKTTSSLLLMVYGLAHGKLESPFVAPLPDGGLELEWETESGSELMLVVPPGKEVDIEYVLDERTGSGEVIESDGILLKNATLSELIDRLTR